MREWIISKAQEADREDIVNAIVALAKESEDLALERETVQKGVDALIKSPERGFYLIARDSNSEFGGCLAITTEWSDWNNGFYWWFQSVYVNPMFRHQGVFRLLYNHVENLAKESQILSLRLYVERDNTIAKNTYQKLGMNLSHYDMFEKKS